MRILGNMVQKLADENKISSVELGKVIGCSNREIEQFFKGRLFLTFDQMSIVAKRLGVSLDTWMDGDPDHYCATVVDCMGEFSCEENREEILDIIDDYLDLRDAVESH